MSADLSRLLNALGLLGIGTVLTIAFVDQFWFGQLPCPLCILQRAGLIAAGVGLSLNLIFGPRPSHYGVAILSAVASGAVSLRQIALHIVPGTGSFGDAVFGMHLYTWAFLAAATIVVGCSIMLLSDRQFSRADPMAVRLKAVPFLALFVFLALIIANVLSTIALCSFGLCPDNPETYLLMQGAAS